MPMITVPLGSRTYPIHIGSGLLDSLGQYVREALGEITVAVVTDDNVAPLYLSRAVKSLMAAGLTVKSITLPHGEQTKCLSRLSDLYDFLCHARITRKDAVIALGGGVIGDLPGLAAATFLRGVRFIQVPTTLLAQVDSSVGGKVAVDLPQGKNLVGAFYQPEFVLIDPDTLTTLTDEFWRDGLGEVVKYGCINDAELFALLEACAPGGREALMGQIDTILAHCVQAKADVVAQDERDTGLRHGEAVSLGMHVMTRLTEGKGMTAPGTAERLDALLTALGMPMQLPDIPEENLISAMFMDKKSFGQVLRVIALNEIGKCFIHTTDVSFFTGMTTL